MPVAGSFVYASTGQPLMHVGLTQWLHPIERYERSVRGYQPPSISPTRRQLIAAGLAFCSLHATTQHLQPMHFVMSKWKRYCSPDRSARWGMSVGVSICTSAFRFPGVTRRYSSLSSSGSVVTRMPPPPWQSLRRGAPLLRRLPPDTLSPFEAHGSFFRDVAQICL